MGDAGGPRPARDLCDPSQAPRVRALCPAEAAAADTVGVGRQGRAVAKGTWGDPKSSAKMSVSGRVMGDVGGRPMRGRRATGIGQPRTADCRTPPTMARGTGTERDEAGRAAFPPIRTEAEMARGLGRRHGHTGTLQAERGGAEGRAEQPGERCSAGAGTKHLCGAGV